LESKPATGQTGNARTGERLQKVLAAAGIASRRECEQLMLEGRVEVDGEVVVELGTKVDRALQEIRVDGEALPRPKRVYYAVHKPTGVVCTARDPSGRPRVIDLLPEGVGRVFNVGRLDINSEGLILVTNDGALADHLTHPRYGVAKTYEAYVQGLPDRAVLDQLRQGVHLAEGFARVVSVRIKRRQKNTTVLELVLDEGRNREVRRLFARVGHKVQRLVRIAIGPIRLGEIPRGAVRKLSPQEVARLRQAVVTGGKKSPSPGRKPSTTGGSTSSQRRKRGAAAGKAVAGKLAKRGRKSASPGRGSRKSAVQSGAPLQRRAR
jgi:23S rRNA pseudouridine2605 synthase